MNVEAQKLEIIDWVLKLKDDSTLKEVIKVKNTPFRKKQGTRKFGGGKNIFTYVAEDFDAPPADFIAHVTFSSQ